MAIPFFNQESTKLLEAKDEATVLSRLRLISLGTETSENSKDKVKPHAEPSRDLMQELISKLTVQSDVMPYDVGNPNHSTKAFLNSHQNIGASHRKFNHLRLASVEDETRLQVISRTSPPNSEEPDDVILGERDPNQDDQTFRNEQDIFINCEVQVPRDSSNPNTIESSERKYCDIKIIHTFWEGKPSYMILLSDISQKVYSNRLKEIENFRDSM